MPRWTNLRKENQAQQCATQSVRSSDGDQVGEELMIYGTAWEKENTAILVEQALRAGFRALDIAVQPKHYREDLVGEGTRSAIEAGLVARENIYVQTKFSWATGSDAEGMPYDPNDSVENQVRASIDSSLFSLRACAATEYNDNSYIDCVLLHSALPTWGQTLEAWKLLKRLFQGGFELLVCQIRHLRSFSFSKCVNWKFCRENTIIYQAFWVLKANPELLVAKPVARLAQETNIEIQAALYGLVSSLSNVLILNGTTKEERMIQDLADLSYLEVWKQQEEHWEAWSQILAGFKELIGDLYEETS